MGKNECWAKNGCRKNEAGENVGQRKDRGKTGEGRRKGVATAGNFQDIFWPFPEIACRSPRGDTKGGFCKFRQPL